MAYNLLQGKKGIIFGALDEKSIAWRTALKCHEEGAQLVLTNAPVIGADVTNMDDLKKLFEEATAHFGGKIDFMLHSIGMSLNVRKGKSYTELDYGFNQKTLDISAMSLHRVLRTAWDMDALNGMGQRGGPYLYSCSKSVSALQRNGRCKSIIRKCCPQFWLSLCY